MIDQFGVIYDLRLEAVAYNFKKRRATSWDTEQGLTLYLAA